MIKLKSLLLLENVEIDKRKLTHLYHATPSINVSSIKSSGLTPKSGNKLKSHDAAIFFVTSDIDAWSMAFQLNKTSSMRGKSVDYTILKIQVKRLPENVVFFKDADSLREAGILTHQSIPSECITVLETINSEKLLSKNYVKEKLKRFYPEDYKHRYKIQENEESEPVDKDKLYYNDSYLDKVAEEFGWNRDFNRDFWTHPQPLYHCTPKENVQDILSGGLTVKSKTGGLSNRGVTSSIFTTMEEEELQSLRHFYGESIFKINTILMKQDGYTPTVEKEPAWERANKLCFVMDKLGVDDQDNFAERYVDSSDGVSDYTVIIYDNIPPKYLSLYD